MEKNHLLANQTVRHLGRDTRSGWARELGASDKASPSESHDRDGSENPASSSRRQSPQWLRPLLFSLHLFHFPRSIFKPCAVFCTEIIKSPPNFTMKQEEGHSLITVVTGAEGVLSPTFPATRNQLLPPHSQFCFLFFLNSHRERLAGCHLFGDVLGGGVGVSLKREAISKPLSQIMARRQPPCSTIT